MLLLVFFFFFFFFFFFKQKTAYEIPLCDWSSDVCSSDLGDDTPRSRPERGVRMVVGRSRGCVGDAAADRAGRDRGVEGRGWRRRVCVGFRPTPLSQ